MSLLLRAMIQMGCYFVSGGLAAVSHISHTVMATMGEMMDSNK